MSSAASSAGRAQAPGTGVYIHTLGCPKNDADSRSLSRALAAEGLSIVDAPGPSDFIVINTCGFIQDAKEESIGAILDACENYGGDRVLVTGCLVERYSEDLRAGLPEVGGWFGLSDGGRLVEVLRGRTSDVPSSGDRSPIGGGSYAYIKISDGCDEACTFCAIPGIKGPYYSVHPDAILLEADSCLSEGARELVLVGQDTAVWQHGKVELTDLIERLAADERVHRIRLMYLQPDHVSEALLHYMAAQPKLCRYLDIPFQHAHPDVLRRMGRLGEASDYLELLRRARTIMPDASVRSTFIVGFPGETDEQFETLLDFVTSAEFDHAGGFVYSPEEGTSAAALGPRTNKRVAKERLARLTSVLASVAERRHALLIDSRVGVMIDSRESEDLDEGVSAIGRTCGQAPEVDGITYIEGELPEHIGPGDTVPVNVTEIVGYDLIGTYGESA